MGGESGIVFIGFFYMEEVWVLRECIDHEAFTAGFSTDMGGEVREEGLERVPVAGQGGHGGVE